MGRSGPLNGQVWLFDGPERSFWGWGWVGVGVGVEVFRASRAPSLETTLGEIVS